MNQTFQYNSQLKNSQNIGITFNISCPNKFEDFVNIFLGFNFDFNVF